MNGKRRPLDEEDKATVSYSDRQGMVIQRVSHYIGSKKFEVVNRLKSRMEMNDVRRLQAGLRVFSLDYVCWLVECDRLQQRPS